MISKASGARGIVIFDVPAGDFASNCGFISVDTLPRGSVARCAADTRSTSTEGRNGEKVKSKLLGLSSNPKLKTLSGLFRSDKLFFMARDELIQS
jgi:hypothetical protein